ncbi:ABC transporter ATP-binding protein [Staphylococcus aureus]|uniref:ABC transporter ATP-binding protein n=1 Tax=Staphylococcus aureus TaxID=1280 RepID=UPI003364DC4F
MLSLKNVSKNFQGFTAVNNLSFDLKKGQMLGFLGRNGAGKTTTFRMILGLTNVSNGTIVWNNKKIDYTSYDNIGYLPEERGLHTKAKVYDELKYLAKLKGVKKDEINGKIDYWLNRFNIIENKYKTIEKLSKGNQQKIQLLSSIIHNPQLLILDEPFSGLDPVNVELLKSAIIELKEQGTSIIFSTHRMEHVEELCDDICILNKGNVVKHGNLKKIKKDYNIKKIILDSNVKLDFLMKNPNVLNIKEVKGSSIITINNAVEAKFIFQKILEKECVNNIQLTDLSLNDIFVKLVGDID